MAYRHNIIVKNENSAFWKWLPFIVSSEIEHWWQKVTIVECFIIVATLFNSCLVNIVTGYSQIMQHLLLELFCLFTSGLQVTCEVIFWYLSTIKSSGEFEIFLVPDMCLWLWRHLAFWINYIHVLHILDR